MSNCTFNNINERDIDLMLICAFMLTPGFVNVFADKTQIKGKDIKVLDAEMSKIDASLGETDVTVIVEVEGEKHGFLVEDKIDAIAMPDQHARYIMRAEKAVRNKEYSSYDIFIFCPEKYMYSNTEAKKYEHCVTYEEAIKYFEANDEPSATMWKKMLLEALKKSKRPTEVILNANANAFTVEYKEYIREYYPNIDIRTKDKANGYWLHINSSFGGACIYHKIPQGFVDLTVPNSANEKETFEDIATFLRNYLSQRVMVQVTGKSCSFRIKVPILDMNKPFSSADQGAVKACCEAIKLLEELAVFMENVSKIKNNGK